MAYDDATPVRILYLENSPRWQDEGRFIYAILEPAPSSTWQRAFAHTVAVRQATVRGLSLTSLRGRPVVMIDCRDVGMSEQVAALQSIMRDTNRHAASTAHHQRKA